MSANFNPELEGYSGVRPFRFWCQKVLPLVYDNSLSYYELLCKVVDYLNNTIADVATAEGNIDELKSAYDSLENYVNTYFDNLDVQEEINNKLDEMVIDGTLSQIINSSLSEAIFNSPKIVRGDVSLNLYSENGPTRYTAVNGICYIGNGRVAVYFASGDSNTGTLRIYDLNNKTIVSQADLEIYHGNSLTYYDGKLYACGCLDVENNVYTNKIFVVDLNTLTVIDTITPAINMIYSLAYSDGKFYAITSIGSVEGEANKVTVFDTGFIIERELLLEHYPAVEKRLNTQGLQCVVDGIGYVLTYQPNFIYGYNLETGKLVYVSEIESVFNGYRYVDEAEGLTYDFDNDDFYLSAKAINGGLYYRTYGTVAKVGVHKNIATPSPFYNLGMTHTNLKMNAILYEERIAPAVKATSKVTVMTNVGDCITGAKHANKNAWINIYLGANTDDVYVNLDNFNGVLNPAGSQSKIPFRGLVITGSDVLISGGNFSKETYANIYGGGTTEVTGAIVAINSTVRLVGTVINASIKLFELDACDFMMANPTIASGASVTGNASSCTRARVPNAITVTAPASCAVERF